MSDFQEFERDLRDALSHLYDPAYEPPESLWRVTGCDPRQGLEALQRSLIQAIERLEPAPHVPATARSRRIYNLLLQVYVQDRTQEETAQCLGITPRHLRRELPECAHVLALRLWAQKRAGMVSPRESAQEGATAATPAASSTDASAEWRSQVRQEIASLSDSAPGVESKMTEVMDDAVQVARALTAKRGVDLRVKQTQPNLVAAIHPSLVRQALIVAIRELANTMTGGTITLAAQPTERTIRVTITGSSVPVTATPNSEFICEILSSQGGAAETVRDAERTSLRIELPSAGKVVLVVDDNPDMLHLYRRYVLGTQYRIVHTGQGQRVFDIIDESAPDVIMLDVMLPDADGWQLLTRLYEDPLTKHIPVVVCSVIQEEDLALALGAALYLAKPVQRQQFIEALDQALSHSSA